MNVSPDQLQATAAQNALTQERTFKQISYPLTGDPECDTISGILCLLGEARIHYSSKVRLLSYLLERHTELVAAEEKQTERTFSPLNDPRVINAIGTSAADRFQASILSRAAQSSAQAKPLLPAPER